jgi:hypothetical protein
MFFSLPRSLIEGCTISEVLFVALSITRCPSRARVFGARPSYLYSTYSLEVMSRVLKPKYQVRPL